MPQQSIDTIGTTDTLKSGFEKVNANFTEVYAAAEEATAAIDERIVGPASAVAGRVAIFSGATGKEVADGSILLSSLALKSELVDLFDFKGSIDGTSQPNYPAALKMDVYRASAAGKVGGASGAVVSVGDWIVALADNAGGSQAAVGSSWDIWQGNLPGVTSAGLSLMQGADAQAQRVLLELDGAVVEESGEALTLGLSAAGKYVRLAAECVITLPNQATVAWLAGTEIAFRVIASAEPPTFALGSGVTLNDPQAVIAALEPGATFAIKRVTENEWDVI
jgi:hypothetical protein